MQINKDGWLEESAQGFPVLAKVPSVRSNDWAPGLSGPLGLVWHWTGGASKTPGHAPALVEEIRTYNRGVDRPASWHVLIAKDGRVFQSVPFTKGSWHVGRPGRIGGAPKKTPDGKWDASAGWEGRLFANINTCTVGVELENAGRLEKVGGKFYCWPFYLHPDAPEQGMDPKYELPAERAVEHGGQFFDAFPEAQEQAATRLLQQLALTCKWSRDVSAYAHLMFDPGRKEDPGPVWLEVVLPRVLDRVFGPK